MEDKEQVEKTVKRGGRTGPRRKRYTYEEKLRAVKLHVEEGFNAALVCQETGVSPSSLGGWLARYRKEGEMGLKRESPFFSVAHTGPFFSASVRMLRNLRISNSLPPRPKRFWP